MSRLGRPQTRVVVPDLPYDMTHRGNRREDLFYSAEEYPLLNRLEDRLDRSLKPAKRERKRKGDRKE